MTLITIEHYTYAVKAKNSKTFWSGWVDVIIETGTGPEHIESIHVGHGAHQSTIEIECVALANAQKSIFGKLGHTARLVCTTKTGIMA